MSRKSIFDILSDTSKVDYRQEYDKLYSFISSRTTYKKGSMKITIERLFNANISHYPYRGTCENLSSILYKLDLSSRTTDAKAVNNLLSLIELLLNVEVFLDEMINIRNDSHEYDIDYEPIEQVDTITYDNCRTLLNNLGYITYEDGDLIKLKNNDVDAIATSLEIEDKDISKLLLDYIDFRNEKDLESKKNILYSIAEYLEPFKDKIPNDDLKNTLFKLFNNVNIRHNNKSGKKKKDLAASLTNVEQLEWYDRTFNLALTAIRLLEFKNDKTIYDQVKE